MGLRKRQTAEKIKEAKKEIAFASAGMLKRLRPAPQGRAHRIRKRSNHVTLILGSQNSIDS